MIALNRAAQKNDLWSFFLAQSPSHFLVKAVAQYSFKGFVDKSKENSTIFRKFTEEFKDNFSTYQDVFIAAHQILTLSWQTVYEREVVGT